MVNRVGFDVLKHTAQVKVQKWPAAPPGEVLWYNRLKVTCRAVFDKSSRTSGANKQVITDLMSPASRDSFNFVKGEHVINVTFLSIRFCSVWLQKDLYPALGHISLGAPTLRTLVRFYFFKYWAILLWNVASCEVKSRPHKEHSRLGFKWNIRSAYLYRRCIICLHSAVFHTQEIKTQSKRKQKSCKWFNFGSHVVFFFSVTDWLIIVKCSTMSEWISLFSDFCHRFIQLLFKESFQESNATPVPPALPR